MSMRVVHVLVAIITVTATLIGVQAYLSRLTPAEAKAVQAARQGPPTYVLPPGKVGRAVALAGTRRSLTVAAEAILPVELLLLLISGAAGWMRDAACRMSSRRWIQGYGFLFLLLLALQLLSLPLQIWGHRVGLAYGLSVQGWGSWVIDKAKLFALVWGLGGLLVMLLFWVIRKSPGKWWVRFWMAAVGVTIAGVFASPYVFDPLFNQFEPLAKSDPALVKQLERVVARGGLSIPAERMFLMKASAKSTELNAYVTGFGASKRVVVWDTTIAKSSPDEIAFIFAHEMGHYALGHVLLGTVLTCAVMLPLFSIANDCMGWILARWGARWRISGQQDWAALVVLLFVLAAISALSDPLSNGVSRAVEHAADVYGQEAMHGIIADPQTIGVRTFQVLGEESLNDPTPHPAFDWWFGTHPPLWFRSSFAAAYDPWRAGEHPKYFVK